MLDLLHNGPQRRLIDPFDYNGVHLVSVMVSITLMDTSAAIFSLFLTECAAQTRNPPIQMRLFPYSFIIVLGFSSAELFAARGSLMINNILHQRLPAFSQSGDRSAGWSLVMEHNFPIVLSGGLCAAMSLFCDIIILRNDIIKPIIYGWKEKCP